MWRSWQLDDKSTKVLTEDTENDVQVIPETDENKVEETFQRSQDAAALPSSLNIPDSKHQQHQQQQQGNCPQSPNYMRYIYLQSQHNEIGGQLHLNTINKDNSK